MRCLKRFARIGFMEQQIRNLGALIEDTNDNVRLIAENFVDVKKGISGLKRDVGELKKDVKVIKARDVLNLALHGYRWMHSRYTERIKDKTNNPELKQNPRKKGFLVCHFLGIKLVYFFGIKLVYFFGIKLVYFFGSYFFGNSNGFLRIIL